MTRRSTEHGTMSALKAHYAAAEPLCDACAAYRQWWLDVHGWGELDRRPCGTVAAYRRHHRNRENIDEACRKAHARALADRDRRRKAVNA